MSGKEELSKKQKKCIVGPGLGGDKTVDGESVRKGSAQPNWGRGSRKKWPLGSDEVRILRRHWVKIIREVSRQKLLGYGKSHI